MSHLIFPCTNESLASMVVGMDVQSDDEILAICGSGDQAFALAEYAQRVVAVDNNPAQVTYAQRRKEKLNCYDIKGFLEVDYPGFIFLLPGETNILGKKKGLSEYDKNYHRLKFAELIFSIFSLKRVGTLINFTFLIVPI